jgi:hypothetical protein
LEGERENMENAFSTLLEIEREKKSEKFSDPH